MNWYSRETLRRIEENDDTLIELGICNNNDVVSSVGRYFTSRDGADYSTLGSYIERNDNLKTLYMELEDIRLSVDDRGFFEGIKQTCSIHEFKLSGYSERGYTEENNPIGEVGCELLKTFQNNSSHLTALHIWACDIGNIEERIIINTTLSSCTNIKWMHFNHNNMTDEQLLPMAEAIRGHRSLETLRLNYNRIINTGCETIASLLQDTNCNLQTLDLSYNQINNEGAIAISNSLENNNKLKNLDISQNQIGNEGAIAIANSLASNNKLKELDIGGNSHSLVNQNVVKDAFARVLCDTSSLNATHSSNHRLSGLFASYEEEERMGDPVVSLLRLNEKTNKSHIAIKKILKYHPNIDMEPLFEWGTEDERNLMALPYVVDWFGRAEEAVKMLRIYMRQREGYNTKERKLSAIYQFALAMPLMFIPKNDDKRDV